MNLATMFPFKKVVKMSDEDKELFKEILERKNTKQITIEQAKIVLNIYANCFFQKIEPCDTCAGVYISIMKKLTKLYNYEN